MDKKIFYDMLAKQTCRQMCSPYVPTKEDLQISVEDLDSKLKTYLPKYKFELLGTLQAPQIISELAGVAPAQFMAQLEYAMMRVLGMYYIMYTKYDIVVDHIQHAGMILSTLHERFRFSQDEAYTAFHLIGKFSWREEGTLPEKEVQYLMRQVQTGSRGAYRNVARLCQQYNTLAPMEYIKPMLATWRNPVFYNGKASMAKQDVTSDYSDYLMREVESWKTLSSYEICGRLKRIMDCMSMSALLDKGVFEVFSETCQYVSR